ncbi:MAG: Crp/Fnr family transcriptional regulator [Methylobacteriaceae bacterium]|nr:Crp/Fnr family transcriptional regulator [Methylobacteriaceae bacterium]MBV9633403.1 Crp/Fnr family transcriptional regulator [Methylobacteriaceae bacterium]MBV9705456.1 Crp/Fnr family transcriptional regulator [Methylobacteriaceae bacterium]
MQTLAQIVYFKGIADIEFEKFDRRCSWKRYEDGEIVVDFEDASTDVYFIISGEVRVLIRTAAGKEIILAELRAGEFFGEYAAIDGIKRSANVTALTRADLCIMPATVFREIVFASRSVCDKVLRRLVGRVRELNSRLAEHSIFDLKHRLYSELLRLSQPRAGHPGQRVVTPPPFHHVLAARIGCRREQVTRELSVMTTESLVEKTRGALVIHKPEVIEMRLQAAMREEG